MNSTLSRLAERREYLVAQAAAQRDALARHAAPWRGPLAQVDRGVEAIRAVGRHPALLLGTALVFVVWRPKRVGKWPRMLWAGWRFGQRMFRN